MNTATTPFPALDLPRAFPAPAAGPLRFELPRFNPATLARLAAWAAPLLAQPDTLAWLLQRSAAYWDKFPGTGDAHHALVEAAATWDLYKHRIGESDERKAADKLKGTQP